MSFYYYLSQELAVMLDLSTEERYHIDELSNSLYDSLRNCDNTIGYYISEKFDNSSKMFAFGEAKRWLEESEHLIPEWKKETEKLQKKISVLEAENKQLKENFKTNVVDIIHLF
jgi:hypothetical protein